MRRRQFLVGLGGAASWPMVATGQQGDRMRRIGVLMAYAVNDAETKERLKVFREALEEFGWIDGRNVQFIHRSDGARADLRTTHAAELVRERPDVILANTAPVTAALKEATSTIPIVFASGGDPVAAGLVSSLSRPGGNVTGFSVTEPSLGGKWFDLLIEAAPNTKRVIVLHAPENPIRRQYLSAINEANAKRQLRLIELDSRDGEQIAQAVRVHAEGGYVALLILPGASNSVHRASIIAEAARHRIPAIYPFHYFAQDGGLLSYGANNLDLFRRAASYVDRILRGESPAALPVQVPSKFDFIINLKTARALGITVPSTLLARADEVIE